MCFVDTNNGWIVGSALILKTDDGGNTWVAKSTETVTGMWLEDVYFVNISSGWAVGYKYEGGDYNSIILHTDDGGENWEEQNLDENIRLYSVDLVDANNGWVVGSNGRIFYTLEEARVIIGQWRHEYNTIRPHSALGYKPPAPETKEPLSSIQKRSGFSTYHVVQ